MAQGFLINFPLFSTSLFVLFENDFFPKPVRLGALLRDCEKWQRSDNDDDDNDHEEDDEEDDEHTNKK